MKVSTPFTIALIFCASTAVAGNSVAQCYAKMNPLDYTCWYNEVRNRCTCRIVNHRDNPPTPRQSTPVTPPPPTREPNRLEDFDAWKDWYDARHAGSSVNDSTVSRGGQGGEGNSKNPEGSKKAEANTESKGKSHGRK